MTPMTGQKIFTCKTSSYSQTSERKPLKPGHMLHEAQYYVVMVSAARCNAQYSFKTTRLKTFGSHLVCTVLDHVCTQFRLAPGSPEPNCWVARALLVLSMKQTHPTSFRLRLCHLFASFVTVRLRTAVCQLSPFTLTIYVTRCTLAICFGN
jgi:hypothetical protein